MDTMVLRQSAWQINALFVVLPLGMVLIVAVVLRCFPSAWSKMVRGEDARRNHTMDGVRGLLSLWVLTHHLNVLAIFLQPGGHWLPERSPVTLLMGSSFFVAPFYTLTGLLFGGGLLVSKGRLPTLVFLRNRVLRLAPAYLVSLVFVFAIVLGMSHFQLHQSFPKVLKEVVRWCSFGFLRMFEINGVDVSKWHGMLWTLPYEIQFYAALPLLAFAQRRIGSPAVLIGGLALLGLVSWPFIFFTSGAVAAAALGWRHPRAGAIWSVAAIVAVAVLIITAAHTSALLQAVLLIPIVAAAALQVRLFYPLRSRPLRFIGEMSYSIYILHFPLICAAFTLILPNRVMDHFGFVERLAALTAVGGVVIVLSALSYVWIERPFAEIGRNGRRHLATMRRMIGYRLALGNR